MMEKSSIAWANDLLERSEQSRFLTTFIDRSDRIKVVNINSAWGTGKTYFLTNWRTSLINDRPTVYFNAWKNDFAGDPLISLISHIRDQLNDYLPASEISKQKIDKFTRSAGAAVIAAAPTILKQVTKKFSGIDTDVIAEEVGSAAAGEEEEDSQARAEVVEKLVEHLITSQKDHLQSVENFKTSLSNLIKETQKYFPEKPIYVFIDELDRCRPTFSIELLERVKHFFDIPDCKFIIATDSTQLSHSIKAIYGQDFSSKEYLKRFFDLSYSFKKHTLDQWVNQNVLDSDFVPFVTLQYLNAPLSSIEAQFNDRVKRPTPLCLFSPMSEAHLTFKVLAETFRTDIRQLQRIVHYVAALASQRQNNFHLFFGAYLVFLKNQEEEIFEDIQSNGLSADVLQRLEIKYPSAHHLYFGTDSWGPHRIFSAYCNVLSMDEHQVSRMFESRNEGPEFVFHLGIDRRNKKISFDDYFDLANLAFNIEA